MKKEEIERLLVDYSNGTICPEDNARLHTLFDRDPALKLEAEEIRFLWKELDFAVTDEDPSSEMDEQFYALLKNAKEPTAGSGIIQIKFWLKSAISIAACVAVFVVGRYTGSPVEVIRYKTTFVRQSAISAPKLEGSSRPATFTNANHRAVKTTDFNGEDIEKQRLEQQLRSVYATERMDAVMKLSAGERLSDSELDMLEMALKEDPNPNVRLSVINALRPFIDKQNVQNVLINTLNYQNDVQIQASVVDLLVEIKSKRAIPQMIVLLENKQTDLLVQDKIKNGIEEFLN